MLTAITVASFWVHLVQCLLLKLQLLVNISHSDTLTAYCDNMGVVLQCADPFRYLVEKQSQTDVLTLLFNLMRELPPTMTTSYKHVKGHLDHLLQEDQLTLEQRKNMHINKLVKAALMAAVQ